MSHYNSHQSSVSSSNILKLFFCLKTKMWLRGFHIFFLFTLSALVKREHSAGNFQYVSVILLPVCLLCKNLFDLCFFNPHKKQIYAVKLRYTEVPATHVQQVCWYQGEHARSAEKFRIIIIFLPQSRSSLRDTVAWKTGRGPGLFLNTLILKPFWS